MAARLRYAQPPDTAATLAALGELGVTAREASPLGIAADLPAGPPVAEVLRCVAPHGGVHDLEVGQTSVESIVAAM